MSKPYAPNVHFMVEKGWLNDPNGLVYFNDQWHLFFQFYEPSDVDGLQWGHAVSDDLINWRHLPPAISPDHLGQIWSGSAVVDHKDSSGLFGGKPGMVCLFTYWSAEDEGRQSQGLAYSSDGEHFTVYEGNPVIPQLRYLDGHPDDPAFRDPKVFWHEPTQKWIMAVAGGKLRIFSSSDLIHWDFEHLHDDLYTECPDLFEMPIDGDPNNTTWLLSMGGRTYYTGDFDGKVFTPQSDAIPMTTGPDFYAGQSWSDAPDNRRIMISWLFTWHYDTKPHDSAFMNQFPTGDIVGSCLGLPHELSLRSTPQGPRLVQVPVAETNDLWAAAETTEHVQLSTEAMAVPVDGRSFKLDAKLSKQGSLLLELQTNGAGTLRCGFEQGKIFIDRRDCGFAHVEHFAERFESDVLPDGLHDIQIVVDSCSVEIFANHGQIHHAVFALIEEDPQATLTGDALLAELRCAAAQIAVRAS